ncbi:fatty acid desaturase [Sphingomonas sp.]|jgi:beta-carotene hydroxylase|uniref:fatty acid desaturase n=1 Tax=Sphingomonas sp. TaxID=28214 RepID=UPI002DE5F231|nr:fatty acid desaturase [Sphingomonas sp.]HEV2569144.1 fatty acid desaturase [Sphingomonas sp.]
MLSNAVESEAARALSPRVAWPTLTFAALLLLVQAGLLALGIAGNLSPWWLTLPLGLCAYLSYTPAHEAIHRNIVRSRRFDPVNRLIGWWSALSTGMSWPLLLRTHLAHHTHTNAPEDPDAFVQGSLPRLFALAALSVGTNLIPVPIWGLIYGKKVPNLGYLDGWKVMSAAEWRQHQIAHTLTCLGVWSLIFAGQGAAVFALYVVPATMGRLLMGIFLSWLPHRPFTSGDRYRTATIRNGRLLALVSMGHSLHLVHHLWPRVPFYRYGKLYRQLAPVLSERGVEIG